MVRASHTAWKVSKYRVFSGPDTGKCGPEQTPFMGTFHRVTRRENSNNILLLSSYHLCVDTLIKGSDIFHPYA